MEVVVYTNYNEYKLDYFYLLKLSVLSKLKIDFVFLNFSGGSHDIFAADVYYHQSCYIQFVLKPVTASENEIIIEKTLENNVLQDFLIKIVIDHKSAFLLSNLLMEFNELCVKQRVNTFINNTRTLKRTLVDKFGEELGFYSVSRYVIVFSTDVNPCEYSLATLKGNGLQDFDIIKSLSNLIKRKIVDKESIFENFRNDANSLLENIELYKPQRELYNIIYSNL